ncbi:AT hook containing transcription factor 1 homolog isoform X2 [Bombus fervidus]|uniref:AT hook containing transcription factor 1 homolog isoform X2 n=1 Tax=Bombus fervidus TaxID=203811 RepID=UPI003AB516C9
MKELGEVSCEIRSVVDIQHSITKCLNNIKGDDSGPSNGSQIYNGLDGVYGGFLNDATYAWLSYGCHLVVLNTKTGESTSSWTFRGKITCVCQFPAQCGELPLLLVGLDNEATRIKDSVGLLCIFDCTSSRVLRAIKMPAGVEQVCIVSGATDWEGFNDRRPDNILMQMDGIACVVLRNLYHLMIDLQRSTWEIPDLSITMDEISPAEIQFLTTKDSFHRNSSKHMTCNLLTQRIEKHIGFNRENFELNTFLDEKLTNTIISSMKIGCLISGCLGRVIIWQNDGSVGWISVPMDETMIITHLALLEPTDDPRPFYYLWVVFQDDSFKMPPILRMFALLFQRKYCDRGTNLYFNLEGEPSLKFEIELDPKDRVVSLSTFERGTNLDQTESECRKGEDSLLLISTTNRTLLFDLNQWYKEQMPQTLSECKNPNSILSCYNTNHRACNITGKEIISCAYIPRTLQEFPNNSLNSSEELFYPNSLFFEWIELSLSKLTSWYTRGVQAELLREIALAGPIMLTQPSEMFHKCLSVGLTPFNTEISFSSDHNAQRDMLLSLCLEQRWATFLIKCAKEWSDGSAAYMYPSFLKWGIQRASSIKMIADRLCIPLFDQSGNNIGESEVKTLRFCYQQLECLSNVVAKLPFETSSLIKQRRALKRVSMYFQVLLWFYDVGLLPESECLEEGPLPISLALKIPYPFEKLFSLYKEKRESIKDNNAKEGSEEVLFIDELIARECPALNLQWEREAGEANTNGYYPPPSLQSLLRSYLTDCDQTESNEIECKHQITIYLLMDLAMLLQGSYPGVDQLIKYPSSFKMSPSLIKLTQAFWLLDHEDYQGFLDMMTGQLVSDSDVKDWHHKLVLKTLIRNSQHKLALMYLRIKKPPLSSFQEQSTLISLSVEHGLVQSAFHHRLQSHYTQLLMCFFQSCKNYNKLGDILHLALDTEEEEMFVKFLEDSKSEDIKLLYYLQRCRYMEANSGNTTTWFSSVASKNMHFDMLNAYNATLPNVVKRFSMNMGKSNLDADLESRYPRPMTHNKSFQKTANIYETVIRKAKETYVRTEKSVVPFVTAPCAALKSSNDRININCVMSPKMVQMNNKRTLEQVLHDEENSGMRTPERTKRRKLLDDSEAALSAAFSTPLVKRKISTNRDIPIETPHSILKIRQLIRSSTSPIAASLQDEITGSPVSDGERKVNRQIRFNISQSKNSCSHGEVSREEEFSKLNTSDQNDEMFVSPATSEKCLIDSPVLSDSSFTCKNIYTARPRPSLRRTYLQTSTESINESLSNCSKTKNSVNSRLSVPSVNMLNNRSLTNTPQVSKRLSTLSSSSYSPAVLSPDSSFEIKVPSRKSDKSDLQRPLKIPKQENTNHNSLMASIPVTKSSSPENPRHSSEEPISTQVEEDIVPEAFYENREKTLENIDQSNHLELRNNKKLKEDVKDICINRDVSSSKVLANINEDHEGDEEEYKSLSKNDVSCLEHKEQRHQSFHEKLPKEFEHDVEKHVSSKNGVLFDITDDESSNGSDEVFLVLDEPESKEKQGSKTVPMNTDNIFDASNITDDESDSSIEVLDNLQRNTAHLDKEENICDQSRFSQKKEENAEEQKTKDKSIRLDNNNSNYRRTRRNSVRSSSDHIEPKDIVNTSNLDSESPEITPRMTRSRRASSISKETTMSPLNSPCKVLTKTPRSRRASSLVKEVLIASVVPADESVKQIASSGSDGSSGISSPRKIRGKRASSVAKDISIQAESEEDKVPVRRSLRRSASIQKELPESSEKKVQTETKSSNTKQSSGGSNKSSTISIRSRKESQTSEQDEEEPSIVKSSKRRGSSVPKESVNVVRTTRRSSSIAKEIVSKDLGPSSESVKEQYFVEQVVSKPAANTRSRRSSIQSIPEELEEILSVPLKERVSTTNKRQEAARNPRLRRAASVELSQVETRRKTRSARSKEIFEETIMEEEGTETISPIDDSKKVSKKRKRGVSETSTREANEATSKPRRGTKQSTKQDTKDKAANQFSFSQPEKTDDQPLDQNAIGEVPKYMFSPPHTRSKTMASDHH